MSKSSCLSAPCTSHITLDAHTPLECAHMSTLLQMTPLVPTAKSQELSNIAWSLAKLGHVEDGGSVGFLSIFLEGVTESLSRHNSGGGGGGRAPLGGGAAGGGAAGGGMGGKKVIKTEWNNQETSNMAWALATMKK